MKISDFYTTIKLEIKELGVVYEITPQLTWVDAVKYEEIEDAIDRGKFLLSKVIAKWNLDDDDGKPLIISEDNVARLPAAIAMPMTEQILGAIGEHRKQFEVKKKNWLRSWLRV